MCRMPTWPTFLRSAKAKSCVAGWSASRDEPLVEQARFRANLGGVRAAAGARAAQQLPLHGWATAVWMMSR